MNVDAAFNVGSTTDSRGIVEEVKVACRAEPSLSLAQASYQTYQRLRAERR